MPAAFWGIAPGFGRLWAASLLLPLVTLLAAGWWAWSNVMATTYSEMARSVNTVRVQVLRTLETQEVALVGTNLFVSHMPWSKLTGDHDAYEYVHALDVIGPTVLSVGVVDPTGHIALSSIMPDPPRQPDLSDRDYVRAFPPGTARRETFISTVVRSRIAGEADRLLIHTSIPRLDATWKADGGVIVSALQPRDFEDAFRAAVETPSTGFTLARTDGVVLARVPLGVAEENEVVPQHTMAMLARLRTRDGGVPKQGDVGFDSSGSLLTGLDMLAATSIEPFGLILLQHLDPNAVRDNWLQRMLFPTIGACAAMALLLMLTGRAQARILSEQGGMQVRTKAAEAGRALAQERALLEAQLRQAEKVSALGQLSAGVAHDFNNLLQTILLNGEMLHLQAKNDLARNSAGLIVKATEHGITLTRQMLDLARGRSNAPQEDARLDVWQGLSEVRALVRSTLGTRHAVRLERVPEDVDLPQVRGDAAAFEIALINLVINARDAMPNGGPITVTAALDLAPNLDVPPGHYVRVAVTDLGMGMDRETLAQAGRAFFTTKGPGKGTGLGLSMVRGFASQCGGTLHLQSEPGKGTTVMLWLPVA